MPGRYDRYRMDIHHVAFRAPSRESVNERLRWARLLPGSQPARGGRSRVCGFRRARPIPGRRAMSRVLEQPAPGQRSALVERDLRERAVVVVESLCRELSGSARAEEDVKDDAPVVEAAAHATSCKRPFNGLRSRYCCSSNSQWMRSMRWSLTSSSSTTALPAAIYSPNDS